MAERLPKKVSGYVLESILGSGGMGDVFLGRHELLERPLAIKRLRVSSDMRPSEKDAWNERFVREGRALSKLTHEHIVGVHDLFEHRGELYMALDLVDGWSVADLLKGGALPIDVACILGMAVCSALEKAHFHAVIRRDVKPANVMVSRDGAVKLMDFGIAKDGGLEKLTETGSVVGTPNYMAPEVLGGATADEATDVYAAAALVYECLAGRRLFAHATADNFFALVRAGKHVKLDKVAPHVPWRLCRVVEKALHKDPRKRTQTAAALRQGLELFLSNYLVMADHRARLVAWLHASGKVGESEALTVLEASQLVVEEKLRRRTSPWRVLAAAAALVSVGLFGGALVTDDVLRAKVWHVLTDGSDGAVDDEARGAADADSADTAAAPDRAGNADGPRGRARVTPAPRGR